MKKIPRISVCTTMILCFLIGTASAQMFYATSESKQQMDAVDFTTGVVTDLYNMPSRPDSLLINSKGQIIYTVPPLGLLELFDPATSTNTTLANLGVPNRPRDMVFDPGGTSLLIALYGSGKLARYNLTSGTVTIFPAKKLGNAIDGLAYDPAGHLFAVISHYTVCQLDPKTGAVLQTLVLEPQNRTNGGDGMVYDPYTGNLWVSHDGTLGNGLIEIPLTQTTPPVLGSPILFQTGNIKVPDGVTSDGQGNLYIGAGLQFLVQYNIPGNKIEKKVPVPGIDSVVFVPLN